MALVLALAAIAIITALLGGALLLTVSHLALSHTSSCYANALNLAEAGVNWELWKIRSNPASADQNPITVEYPPDSGRTFTVHVEAYPGGGMWTPPEDLWVIATGTVDRTSRTVRVQAGADSVLGEYALFGINSITLGGSAHIIGGMGSNGDVTVNSNLPTGMELEGDFWYCGDDAGGEDLSPYLQPGYQEHDASLPEYFPTVNDLANQRALDEYGVTTTDGIDFFRTTNSNSQATAADGTPVTLPTIIDKNTFGKLVERDADGNYVIVLGPGDYYFEGFNLGSNDLLRLDTAAGVVNVWLGPDGGGTETEKDIVNGNCLVFTGTDVTDFHLYEGSRRTLQMNGTMDFYGMIEAYNGPDDSGNYYGTVVLNGNGTITGSVIAGTVNKAQGDLTITFPSGGGSELPTDPSLFYQYRSWEEVGAL
jgi:hypothetical protein